jgi:hypothetical protein
MNMAIAVFGAECVKSQIRKQGVMTEYCTKSFVHY